MNCSLFKHLIPALVFYFSLGAVGAQELPYLYKENGETKIDKAIYREYLNNHPFANRPFISKEEIKAMDKKDRPDLAYEHDWLMTHDPSDGKIHWERLIPVLKTMNATSGGIKSVAPGGSTANKWTERGPNNVGGRVRAMMFDPNDATNKKVFAGGVGGGLWYNNDITSSSSSWNSINDFWTNLAVSCITYDPTSKSTFYVGTGEGFGNSDAIRGAGIWKSTNKGSTWTQLSASSTVGNRIMDVKVTSTGRLVVASSGGVYTSDNGGTSFTRRISSTYFADLEIAANGDLYAGTRYSGRLYKSTNNGTNWTQITGLGGSPERIEIACAPSDSNTVYIVASGGSGTADVEWFKKSSNAGSTWSSVTIPGYKTSSSAHFTRQQAWYDLILWVHPTNKNIIIAGGVDLHRSSNGGSTWSFISYWNQFQAPLPVVHADQHAIVSRPGNSNEVIFGNDGGVYYSSNCGNSSATPTFGHRVKDFNVTQYYSAAMAPSVGADTLLAGAQDNGTHLLTSSGIGAGDEVTGGDGAFCFIDQNNSNVYITSYIRNNWRVSTNSGNNFTYLTSDNTGSFINPADYDDNKNILYSARNSSTLKRITNIGSTNSAGTISISGMSATATHIRVSEYTTSSSTLFVGSGGDVFKVTNADGSPSTTMKSSSSFPSGSISCIELGASENELLVTFSNYGSSVKSVWYSSNGGSTWVSKEGNLPDMPVRWALFNPKNRKEVILATELGVWATDDISVTSPVWKASNNGFANTRVDMLKYRKSDSLIMASTHGRGIFTGRFKSSVAPPQKPVASFTNTSNTITVGDSVVFTSTSTNTPTSLNWSFPGGSITSSTSMTPVKVFYNSVGSFDVSLKATNAGGADSITKVKLIVVSPSSGSKPVASFTNTSNTITVGDSVVFTSTSTNTPTSLNWSFPGGSITSSTSMTPVKVFYNSVGSFDVSLKASNASGADSITKAKLVVVGSSSGSKPIANFTVNVDTSCTGDTVIFTNSSSNSPTSLQWTFTGGTPSSSNSMGPVKVVYSSGGVYSVKLKATNSSGVDSIVKTNVLFVRTAPVVTVGNIGTQCSNAPNFTLTNGSPSGGTYSGPGVTGGSTFSPSTAGMGLHTLKYKVGPNFCSDSVNFIVSVAQSPSVSLGAIGPFCTSDNSVKMTVSPTGTGGTLSGPGISGLNFDPSAAGGGTHTIKYVFENSFSCKDSATTKVVVNTGSTLSFASLNNICKNAAPFTLTQGSPKGGIYSGSGVSSDSIFNPSSAGVGTHTLTYTDSTACGSPTVTQTITVDSIPVVTTSNDTGYCTGGSVKISGFGASTYEWSPRGGLSNFKTQSPTANPTNSTKYTVTGNLANGCSATDSVWVVVFPNPTVDAGKDDTICKGDTFQLNATGAQSYQWFPPTGLSATNISNPTGSISSDQIYFVDGVDSNGCKGQGQVTIIVKTGQQVSLAPLKDVCLKDSAFALSGGSPSGGVYIGTGVVNNMTFSPALAGAGTHKIIYASALSGACVTQDSQNIVVSNGPTINWPPIGASCEGDDPAVLNAAPSGGTYSGNGIVGNTFDPSVAGNGTHIIQYTVKDSNNCEANMKQSINVSKSAKVDTIRGQDNVVKNKVYNYDVKAVNGSSYLWSVVGGSIISQRGNTSTIRWGKGNVGELSITQTNPEGCQDSTKLEVAINVLGTGEFELAGSAVKLFPNPADDELQIQFKGLVGEIELRMFNSSGQEVYEEVFNLKNSETKSINVNHLATGIYHIALKHGNEIISNPVVIKR